MAHAAEFYQPIAPEKRPERARARDKRIMYGRGPGFIVLRRRALVARLRRKARLADNPANWVTLTGLSDEQAIAILRRR